MRWWTTTNYDLFVYDDRLVAVKGLTLRTMRDGLRDERLRNAVGVGERDTQSFWELQRTQDQERIARRTPNIGLESVESSDRIVVELADVVGAKLSKRAGIVALRLNLKDGTTLSWRWMNNSAAIRYTEAAPVLRDVLGSRLRE